VVEDDRRQNRLMLAGYRLLRYGARDLYKHRDVIVDQVRNLRAMPPLSRSRRA
jgi:hypothetical protein